MKTKQCNDTQIEQWGVDAVANALSVTDTLQRFFKENDKTPLWDGEIFIYKNNGWKNENFIGKVSVQLKGKLATKEELSKEIISYPVGIVNLENYKKNGGTIYFVTQINKRNTSQKVVYYETLTPQKISTYIKGKEQQESCTIKLKRLPKNKYKIQTIFHNFYPNSRFGNIPPISLDELSTRKDVVKITSSIMEFLPKNKKISPIDVLLNNEVYWTAELSNSPIPIPIELTPDMQLAFVSKDGLPSIIVNGEKYDNYLSITRTRSSTIFKFGESTTLTIQENTRKANIKYTPSDSLTNRIKDLSFVISIAETSAIHVEGKDVLHLGEIITDSPFDLRATKKALESYKRLDKFWKSLNVTDDFDIGKIDSNSSLRELDLLIESIDGKQSIHINTNGDNSYYLLKKPISNFLLLLLLEAVDQEKNLFNVYNYFDQKGIVKIARGEEAEHITSKYSALSANDYIELSNIVFSDILQSYKDILHLNNKIYEPANFDLLNLLLAYDKHEEHPAIILETAKDIARWILEESGDILPDEIKVINYLQTIKRARDLTKEEISKLYHIADKSENIMYKLGANLLLENYKVAPFQFDQLSDEEKDQFKSFPIYRFWQ
ncbi:MAG: hypothetical protein PHG06_15615 [Parabacteroides sp.]|nr:hypothetical protein [Parabacteroides sp.]OJV36542.1 MAG: hypothetical protein BGO33_12670 [Bacteroidia bacterium 43-41]